VVRGLDEYGYGDLAREIAAKHLNNMSQVYKTTGTIWENYAPESPMQGKPAAPEFVGWSGLGPIAMLIEDIIGIRADAARNLIYWRVKETGRHGVHYFKFGGHTVSLLADPRKSPDESPMLHVTTDSTIKFLVEVGKCREQYTLTEGVYNIKACDIPN
ncbi:MAG TPA: trehalase family glycosidase, partial [bacterium]|nr:trehalase family glycosidase [bacterium]